MDNNELVHWGVKGMKWGVRRYQNRDGTLTAAGKKRYEKELARLKEEERIVKNKERTKAKLDKLDAKKADLDERKKALEGDSGQPKKRISAKTDEPKPKSLSEMDDRELEAVVRRMNLEERYNQLNPPTVSKGKKFLRAIGKDVVAPAVKEVSKNTLKNYLENAIKKASAKSS